MLMVEGPDGDRGMITGQDPPTSALRQGLGGRYGNPEVLEDLAEVIFNHGDRVEPGLGLEQARLGSHVLNQRHLPCELQLRLDRVLGGDGLAVVELLDKRMVVCYQDV